MSKLLDYLMILFLIFIAGILLGYWFVGVAVVFVGVHAIINYLDPKK